MRSLIAILLITTQAFAGLPPTTSKGSADSNNVTTFNFQFPNFTGTHTGTTFSLGVNSIAGGGTGQITANAALNALLPSQTGNSGKFLTTNGTSSSWSVVATPTPGPAGTVTSVNATVPSRETVSGVPITGAGTIAITDNAQAANTFLAGGASASATPAYRLVVPADIPNLDASKITTGVLTTTVGGMGINASSLTGVPTFSTGVPTFYSSLIPLFGGTGLGSATPYAILTGGTSSGGNFQQLGTGTTGQILISQGSSALPVWTPSPTPITIKAPTVTELTSTGTQTGWLFTISTSSTVAVGDTYTNNAHTYTVQGALSAQSGQVLWMSGTGATSGTTLTRSTGSGTSSITFSTTLATATYTLPTSPPPLYLTIEGSGSGGGGGGGGTSAGVAPTGNTTFLGPNILTIPGGGGGQNGGLCAQGGAPTVAAGLLTLKKSSGVIGQGGGLTLTVAGVGFAGGSGGSNPLGGGGGGADEGGSGAAGDANSGGGGGGGSTQPNGAANLRPGTGGCSGSYWNGLIVSNIATSYPYIIGASSAGGTAGTNGSAGGVSGSGVLSIQENYQ